MGMNPTHQELLAIVRCLPDDYAPFGENMDREGDPTHDASSMSESEYNAYLEREGNRYRGDCSCGCRYFAKLRGELGLDWGICWNPQSHRAGLLTFEHQGCPQFTYDTTLDS